MKKMLFAIIMLLLFFFSSYAQPGQNKISFGIKGGYNHTVINGRQTNGDKTGFIGSSIYGSLSGEMRIGENKFLGAELLYSWVNDWNFIEIPVHFREMLNRQISIFAGPKLDVAADRFDSTKESKSGLIGLSAEAGGQYDFRRHLFAEVRYSVGISRSFNDPFFDINNARRNNFRLGIGYRF
jgi:hypothetical protein